MCKLDTEVEARQCVSVIPGQLWRDGCTAADSQDPKSDSGGANGGNKALHLKPMSVAVRWLLTGSSSVLSTSHPFLRACLPTTWEVDQEDHRSKACPSLGGFETRLHNCKTLSKNKTNKGAGVMTQQVSHKSLNSDSQTHGETARHRAGKVAQLIKGACCQAW